MLYPPQRVHLGSKLTLALCTVEYKLLDRHRRPARELRLVHHAEAAVADDVGRVEVVGGLDEVRVSERLEGAEAREIVLGIRRSPIVLRLGGIHALEILTTLPPGLPPSAFTPIHQRKHRRGQRDHHDRAEDAHQNAHERQVAAKLGLDQPSHRNCRSWGWGNIAHLHGKIHGIILLLSKIHGSAKFGVIQIRIGDEVLELVFVRNRPFE